MHKDLDRVLFSKEDIDNITTRLGKEITEYYRGKDLVVVGILKGAAPFMMDLIRKIDLDFEIDFMQISSYSGTNSGTLLLKKDVDADIDGKDVLFVDDIIDTGKTALKIIDVFQNRKVNSVNFCCLLDKKERRLVDYEPRFVGSVVPNYFVVGYGMDFNEKYRNLDVIGVLKEEMYKEV